MASISPICQVANPNAVLVNAIAPAGWQLVYTVARHEKMVAAHLGARNIEHYVPLYQTVRQWGTRSVRVDLPLFPCYVFIRLTPSNLCTVRTVPGIVSIVSFQGQPASVPEEQIAVIRNVLGCRHANPHPYIAMGQRVKITSGPMRGVVGVIDRIKGLKVIVSVDLINSSIAIEAEPADLESAA